jgi:starch synthase
MPQSVIARQVEAPADRRRAAVSGLGVCPGLGLSSSIAVTPARATSKSPRVLFVTPEMGDFIKVGGLGDVSSSLPRAMREIADVRVLLPGYPAIFNSGLMFETVRQMPAMAELPAWTLLRARASDGLVIYVVDCPSMFAREGTPYGPGAGSDFVDNAQRFARLSLSAAEIAAGEADPDWKPTILHANDWPTAMALAYARWKNAGTKGVFTIHNLAYQGLFDPGMMAPLGIPGGAYDVNGLEFHGKISFLKAGIFYASHVTTVSETYAHEITTEALGCGLHGLLSDRAEEGRLTGILNGLDEDWRDPQAGMSLMKWKKLHADDIRRKFHLSASSGPLFSIISRLVHQKGIDLSLQAAETIVGNGGQLVVTGRGEPQFEKAIEQLAARHRGAVAARIGYDESEARDIFAASDFLLMPSRFEPCGLSQMYAQKSGALPIAFRTGGLADTIEHGRSGFLFSRYSGVALSRAVARAIDMFTSEKAAILRMRRYAATRRYEWARSARDYLALYTQS